MPFLSYYQGVPNHGHYEAALHALIYLVRTSPFGIFYRHNTPNFTKSFVYSPPNHYEEAYTDTTPPQPNESHKSTLYSGVCLGIQIWKLCP